MEAIINNLANQLLALQAEINQRDQPIPTLQEVNTQVKLGLMDICGDKIGYKACWYYV